MKRLFPCLIAALTLLATPVSAADWVILDSTSPEIKAGTIRPGGQVITLAADMHITMIGPSGQTVVVEGPYTGSINTAIPVIVDRLTGLKKRDLPIGDFPSLNPDYYE